MHRSTPILHLGAVWLFVAGFVLVGSGWGPTLSRMMSSRPSWSVCGQAMCECQPIDMPADCPLCLAGEAMPAEGTPACTKDQPRADATRLLIRRTQGEAAMARLDAASQMMLLSCFLVGVRTHADSSLAETRARLTLDAWRLPLGAADSVPTPPPRA